jgi:transcriptional regulator with XRE-family HTH domain
MPKKRLRPDTIPEIARRLRLLRMAVTSSQAEFCRRAGISTQLWNNYERGLSRIGIDTAISLQRKFAVPLDWIYLGIEAQLPNAIARKIEELESEEPEEPIRANG